VTEELRLPEKILKKVDAVSRKLGLSEAQKKKVLKRVAEVYENSRYEPGEAIGVVTAQSVSEPATQMTMRTYHVAGAAQIQVTLGLPRLMEIFDARRTPTTPTMTIYLKKDWNTREKALDLVSRLRETRLEDIASDVSVDILNKKVEISLDPGRMEELGVTKEDVEKAVKESVKKGARVSARKVSVQVEGELQELQKMKTRVLSVVVKGIKGIKQAVVTKSGDEWVITTLGSNLQKAMQLEGVDPSRIVSNDIHEMAKTFGIEAARRVIIDETVKTLEDQGLDVDVRHILLVADAMTVDGTVKAIGRYGVAGSKGSVLARANFEETIKHLTTASVRGEVDYLESIVENVMINQVVPVGTGMFELVFRPGGGTGDRKRDKKGE